LKFEIEGFVIRIKAETKQEKEDLKYIAKLKIHYYPERNMIEIF